MELFLSQTTTEEHENGAFSIFKDESVNGRVCPKERYFRIIPSNVISRLHVDNFRK